MMVSMFRVRELTSVVPCASGFERLQYPLSYWILSLFEVLRLYVSMLLLVLLFALLFGN